MTRKELLAEVEHLFSTYCDGCFLQKQFKKDKSKTYAHRFCISKCTVGEKIRACGEKLSSQGT
ncbi:zinc-finger domain-containing protein [Bacillus sp. T33-2]|uniref:zinc-finger domain-containing protein n=1 Tax=Bacillus sp. T33-2 TaxID=2054168 RepID=UPI000C771CC1|nr:zinc-finger domain-containing protein [Bacillus sp. T33-2]PLR99681.1 zinc-finger domain-containing protein [Bacillus sp. T33-2]